MILGAEGWQVFSAAHWAERHGLIVIIALGESIVSIGVGVAFLPISWPIIVASVLGIAIAASLWWAYFDVLAIGVERTLHRLTGTARASLAIHAYTYLHLPLIAGIIFTSLGMKKVMEYVGDTDAPLAERPAEGRRALRAVRRRDGALPPRARSCSSRLAARHAPLAPTRRRSCCSAR